MFHRRSAGAADSADDAGVAPLDANSRLALRAAAGDRDALAALIRATQRDVWRYLAFQAGAAEADDLTQETFLRAITSLPSFQGRSSVLTWLLVIARRVVIDDIRRRMVRPKTVSTADWQGLAERTQSDSRHAGAASIGELVEFEMLLEPLTAERREVLLLTQVLGLSYAQTAEICGCPIGTVRSRVARGWDDLVRISKADHHGNRASG